MEHEIAESSHTAPQPGNSDDYSIASFRETGASNASSSHSYHHDVVHGGDDSLSNQNLQRENNDTGLGMENTKEAEDAEPFRVVERLETDIAGGDYMSFLNELDHRGTGGTTTARKMEENVVIEGFRLLRYYVIRGQTINPSIVVLTGEGWVKTIKSKFMAFEKSRAVAVDGLLTFLSLSSLPGNYKNLIVKRGGIDCAMRMLENYREDKEVCSLACALLLSLSLNEKEGLNANYLEITTMIKQLVSLISRGGCGTDFALRVLFQFTSHKKKLPNTAKSLSHMLKNIFLEAENNIVALLNVMKEENARESSVEAAISLLWRLSVPQDEFDGGGGDDGGDDLSLTSKDPIETVIATMDSFDSITIREAGCGIFANLSIRKDFAPELAQKSFLSMQKFLPKMGSVDEGLATCALHAICNMLEKSTIRKALLSDRTMMETVILIMAQYPKSEELIEFGCLAIGRAARHAQGIKELFMSLGAFEVVKSAFHEFVTSREDDPSLDVKDASLCAFATLTGCRSGAEAAKSTGLIEIFQTLLAVETDRDFAVILDIIIANTRTSTATNDGFSMSPENILREKPHMFDKLMISTSFSDLGVSSLIKIMLGAHQTFEIAFCVNEGFPTLLSAMTQCTNSISVQKNGCQLLAEIYFHLPYPINAEGTILGPWSPQNQREALKIIHIAMKFHSDIVNVQLNGCLAILNLLYPIPETDRGSLDRQAISSVIELCYEVILGSFCIHGSDVNIHRSGLSALALSVSVAEREDFEPWATRIVRRLFQVLLQFDGNYPIQALALDALIIMQERHPTIQPEYSSSDVDTLLTLNGSDSNEVSGRSSTMLSSILHNNPESSAHITEYHGTAQIILSVIESKRGNLQIQINIYTILHELVTFSQDHCVAIAQILDQYNGIQALCMGISSHPRNKKMTISLCKILSSIICFLDPSAFVNCRDAIKFSLIEVLENHAENPQVDSFAFDVLCTCCERDNNFKEFLLEETRTRLIISTMQFSLGSADLQKSGCNLLSALSNFGAGKEKIGNFGGIPVIINALQAHNDSVEVQKKGLVTLKNLATAPTNKPMIADMGGETTVIYSLWIHYRDPEVVSAGLSALNNIAVNSLTRSVAKMNDQVLGIVISAMQGFVMDELVQKNACFYLKTCSYLPDNVQMMCENTNQLIPLLLQAGDNFPTICGDRATAVVRKITMY